MRINSHLQVFPLVEGVKLQVRIYLHKRNANQFRLKMRMNSHLQVFPPWSKVWNCRCGFIRTNEMRINSD